MRPRWRCEASGDRAVGGSRGGGRGIGGQGQAVLVCVDIWRSAPAAACITHPTEPGAEISG